MPSEGLWLDPKFTVAQADALKQKLPLAAVTCIEPGEYSTKLTQLLILEKQLEKHEIPLIVLVGTEAATLPSLVKHTQPVYVYGHGGEGPGNSLVIKTHPYKWPGIVIKVKELAKIVDKNEYMC